MNLIEFEQCDISHTGLYGDTLKGALTPALNVYTAQLISRGYSGFDHVE